MADSRDQPSDEVHRLLDAVQEWANRFLEPAGHGGETDPPRANACLPWCPICQFANVVRGEHPELTERFAEAATAAASAIKALADAALNRAAAEPGGKPQPRPGPRVEHITLDDVTEP